MNLILFDFDGTISNSQFSISQAMVETFLAHELVAPSHEDVLSIIGLSLEQAIHKLYPEADEQKLLLMVETYKAAFYANVQNPEHNDKLYDGIVDVIEVLSREEHVLLGIATGKSKKGLLRVLNKYDLKHHFVTLQTADDAPSKPHPAMIEQAMSETGTNPEATIMVGDTRFDIDMAHAAGVSSVGVSWGYHPIAELEDAKAHHIVNNMTELAEHLSGFCKT